jgi:hypothetical protein
MDSNTYSSSPAQGLEALAEQLTRLAAQDRHRLAVGARAERNLELRRLADRLDGHWLQELAEVDAAGAAGADQGSYDW